MGIKLAIAAVIALGLVGAGWHYRATVAENRRLAADNITLSENVAELKSSLETERDAVRQAISDRAAAQRALDALQAGRAGDPESQAWGAVRVPRGERDRLCEALQGSAGCPTVRDDD